MLRVHLRSRFRRLVDLLRVGAPVLAMALHPSTLLIAIGSFLGGVALSIFNAVWIRRCSGRSRPRCCRA